MHLLSRKNIDDERWNAVVERYGLGLPYAFTWMLDEVTGGNWEAIMGEDYQWVLPLPYNRKIIGLKQYYNPYYLQQLGLIGLVSQDLNYIKNIIQLISKKCIRARLVFNESNEALFSEYWVPKTNFLLNLKADYKDIYENYEKRLKQVLKKNETNDLEIIHSNDLILFLKHYFTYTFEKFSGTEKISPHYVQSLFKKLEEKGLVSTSFTRTSDGVLTAGVLYLKTDKRIILSLQFAQEGYKHLSGPSILIDSLIRKYNNSDLTLDFEGSDIPGISNFYKAFSPEPHYYGVISIR